jgi:hypothetical protein
MLVAEAVHTALTARHPAAAYSVKPDPGRVALNLLPDWIVDGLLEWVLGRPGVGSAGRQVRRRTRVD